MNEEPNFEKARRFSEGADDILRGAAFGAFNGFLGKSSFEMIQYGGLGLLAALIMVLMMILVGLISVMLLIFGVTKMDRAYFVGSSKRVADIRGIIVAVMLALLFGAISYSFTADLQGDLLEERLKLAD